MSMRRVLVWLALVAALVAASLTAVTALPAFVWGFLPGDHLYLDGRSLPVVFSCTRSATDSCQHPHVASVGALIECNLNVDSPNNPAGGSGAAIYVYLPPSSVKIVGSQAEYVPGKSSHGTATGRVWWFGASKGANIDLELRSDNNPPSNPIHLSGNISCP
jgi:hypothetical protein